MNNTKNDKYLRKNRHDKNSKHKHKNKTRKVQSGGGPTTIARGIIENQAAPPSDTTINEIRDANLRKKADDENKRQQESNPELVALAKSPSNIMKSFFLNLFKSKKKELPTALAIDNLTKNISTIIDENDKNLDIVNKVSDAIRKRIEDILKINEELRSYDDRRELSELIDKLHEVGKIAQKIAINSSELAYAATTDGKLNHGPVQPPRKSVDTSEKPSFTQRVKQGFSNMGKTVKNAATSAKNAVTSRFSRKKNDNEDSEGIELQDFKKSNQEEPAATDSTEENKTDNSEKSKTEQQEGDATNPKTSMFDKGKEGFAKVKTAFSNLKDRFTKKNNYSVLPDTDNPPDNKLSGGGNKTRKNRQYIREIKDNRTHLFNKEMEIINSIRNFKHRHTDEPKKQFINVIKRS
jgi:hypothetical protein